MRKVMRKTEIILTLVMCLGIVLIISGITVVAPSILLFSAGILSFLYLIFGFLLLNNKSIFKIHKNETYRDLSAGNIIMGVLLGLCIPPVFISIIFKFLLWANAEVMALTAILTLVVLIIVIAIIQLVAKKIFFHLNLRFFIWSVLIAITYLIPNSVIINAYFLEDFPNYANALKQYEANPENPENYQLMLEEREKLIEAKNPKSK